MSIFKLFSQVSKPARAGGSRAFTLIELVISAALMALILVSAYVCLSACLSSQKMMKPRLEVVQEARVAMALMSADLRAACPLDKNSQFIGMQRTLGDLKADNLDFATHNYTPRRAREGDFCEESFYLDGDPETGQLSLWRRRNPTIAPDPLSGGTKERIATRVAGLQFEYSDGVDWYDNWGTVQDRDKAPPSSRDAQSQSGMPEAVRITLWLDAGAPPKSDTAASAATEAKPEPPMVFQTVVRLNLADASQPASSGGSSTEGTPGTTGESQERPATEGGSQ